MRTCPETLGEALAFVCSAAGLFAVVWFSQVHDQIENKQALAAEPTILQEQKLSFERQQKLERLQEKSELADKQFFAGQIKQAVSNYEAMTDLNPKLETSHWRLGIAYFYAKEYEKSAAQFEKYHSFDNVDRENGCWRFLAQAKASGIKEARKKLLNYKTEDREPFGSVYRMFRGQVTAAEVLKEIEQAEVPQTERNKRLFYAHLYAGLLASVEEQTESARSHLSKAGQNPWPKTAGYGPEYMRRVAELHLKTLPEAAP